MDILALAYLFLFCTSTVAASSTTASSTGSDATTSGATTTEATSTGSDVTTTTGTTTTEATSTGSDVTTTTTTEATSTVSDATTTTETTTTEATSTVSDATTTTTVATTTAAGSCKIDVLYVFERSYYTRYEQTDINRFFTGLTDGLNNVTSGIDLKIGYMTYDSTIDNERVFTANLTQVKLEIEAISTSYSSSYYTKKALEYAYYEFVKLKNGRRSDAYTYYVLLSAHKSSSYPAASIGSLIRTHHKNKMFAVGWLPSSSLESDLISAVGDSDNYFAIDSISADLVPERQALLEKLLTCPSVTMTPILPNCKLDIAFVVDNSRYTEAKYTSTFISEVLDGIDLTSGNIRVAVVTYTSTAVTLFDLNTYNTSDDIRQAVEAMPQSSSYSRYLNTGLEHARDNVFTSGNGDRADAWNYYVFTGTASSDTDSTGRDIRASGTDYLFAIDIGTSYASEWKATIDTCGDESKYIYVSIENNLPTIRSNVTSLITTCPVNNDGVQTTIFPACKIDLTFLLDDASSVSSTEFENQKLLLIDLMKRINISDDGIRVALVTYGDDGFVVFSLNQYNTSQDVQTAIQNIANANSAYGRTYRYVDRAIEYALENVFTSGSGDRMDAVDYYVVITHGYDYGDVDEYVPALTSDPTKEVFFLVVDSSYSGTYQSVVDSDHFFYWPSFSSLTCNSHNFLTNFTHCPSSQTSLVNITTPDCKLDIVFIIEASSSSDDANFLYLKYFFANLASQINVSPTSTRIAAVTYNNDETTVFNLLTYSTSAEVAYAIKQIPDDDTSSNNVDNALAYAESDIFTVANGDRAEADNFYVFSIDGSRSGTATEGQRIRQDSTNHIFAIDIASGYSSEWKSTVGDESKYFYASSYSGLTSIESAVLAAITTCQVTTTTTQVTTTTTPQLTTTTTPQITTTTQQTTTTTTQVTTTTTPQLTTTTTTQETTNTTPQLTTTTSTQPTTTQPTTTTTPQLTTTNQQTTMTTPQQSTTTATQVTTTTFTTSTEQTTTTEQSTSSTSQPTTTTQHLTTTEQSLTTFESTTTATETTTASLISTSAPQITQSSTTTSQNTVPHDTTSSLTTSGTDTTSTTSSSTTTTTPVPTTTKPPQAKCGTQVISYSDFSSLKSGVDNDIDRMYLLTDTSFVLTCCGRISEWEIHHSISGYIDLVVWRPMATGRYKIVGFNSILVNGANTTSFSVLDDERIAVVTGDLIGWRCALENVVTFGTCTGTPGCPTKTRKAVGRGDLTPGMEFDWDNDSTLQPGVAYAVRYTLEDNTSVNFPPYNVSVKDHIKVGGYVADLGLEGVDYMEDVTYQIHPDPADVNQTWKYYSVDSRGIMRTTRQLPKSKYLDTHYMIVTAEDSCDNSATVSLEIATVNWPPFIHSLPNTISIEEDTPPNDVIYTTEVTDAYGDPVCCTLSNTHPQTFNFNVTNDPPGSSTYRVITTERAKFVYQDFNSYLVYMCCDDTEDRAQSILTVNIKKPAKSTVYKPPQWFLTSIIAAVVPIIIILVTGCGLLCHTMFAT